MDHLARYHHDSSPSFSSPYLWPAVQEIVSGTMKPGPIFELGCGNGTIVSKLSGCGFDVVAVDTSEEGVRIARAQNPGARISLGSAYDDLAASYGRFPVVLSLEVIEHCFYPRKFAKSVFDLVQPGGIAVISTPYHGYWKNVALAVTGRLDRHFTALWDGGHIKFWSQRTLAILLREAGFESVAFRRVGRIPVLAKSMIAVARRPA